jgi:hypothetical protein
MTLERAAFWSPTSLHVVCSADLIMEIPTSPFAGDDGQSDPRMDQLIAQWQSQDLALGDLVVELAGARLLVPVVAVLDEIEHDPGSSLTREKDSHMALPLMVRPDGLRGLLAFTSLATLRRWQPDARPIPTLGSQVAAAAIQEGAAALVVDVLGPIRVAIEEPHLSAMAEQPSAHQ